MRAVVDASVVVKWVVRDPVEEDLEAATEFLRAVQDTQVELLQPPHWLAETMGVLTRLTPETALKALPLLDALDLPVADDIAVYQRACELAIRLDHHLFDTLYHAVALERDAVLVTADARYLRKAQSLGRICHLRSWASA
ncbi:MAG: type II toxin-antitoxin system VapC family toxin [Thermoanaerobaculia bacterium]